ncbi:MAG: hypothetical protein PWP51_1100, partial [Clostridiales bacterium]|nr:hypothetical protein [Clostridiales bacterium]
MDTDDEELILKIEQRLIDEVRTHLMNYREDANAVQDAV